MKNLKKVFEKLKKSPIITGFGSVENVFNQFNVKQNKEKILLAVYDLDGYEGYANVFYFKDGKYYEVYGSHCSCYGLEDQWNPEEIVFKELENRILNGYFPGKDILQGKLAE